MLCRPGDTPDETEPFPSSPNHRALQQRWAFHPHLGGLGTVFLTAKPANFLGKAWTKVREHKPLVPGFGGDLGSSSRKAQCRGL